MSLSVLPPATGPVVLVTGASSGIGRATAERYARRGARLVLCARSADVLEEVRAACEAMGAEADVVVTDVADADAVQAAVDHAVTRFGRLDVCVNVAGVTSYGTHVETPAAVFDQVVTVNLLGSANVARSVLGVFREQRAGTLVLVGSLLGRVAVPQMGAYVTSKWGLRGLTRVLQQENRDLPKVRITTVSPGSVRTDIYTRASSHGGRTGSPPPPSTSPDRVARAVVAAVARPRRERDVDAVGGAVNKLLSVAFTAVPPLFDTLVGPLMRQLGTTGVDDPAPAAPVAGSAGKAVGGS